MLEFFNWDLARSECQIQKSFKNPAVLDYFLFLEAFKTFFRANLIIKYYN